MSTSKPLITDSVVKAARWLQQGQLLAYPTESVWGIGCDPFNQQAVQQLLAIKQRPLEKGMIVVTDSASRLTALLDYLSDEQRQFIADNEKGELIVPITVTDESGQSPIECTMNWAWLPKKKK